MNNRVLGTIAMICAPAILLDIAVTAIGGMIFMVGWVCANIGMQRMRATGTGKWGRAVLVIQLVGLVLAVLANFFQATRLLGRESIVFNVIDFAWPFSLLWMVVVGITVIRAKRISDWYRFVPLLCPFWLPIAGIFSTIFGEPTGSVVGYGYAAVLWGLLGYIVRSNSQQSTLTTPEPTVR
jgi:hypothetical protein